MGGMRRAGALALTVVLGLGLVACGGDDSTDTGASGNEDATTTTAEATDSGTDSSDTTDVDLSDFTGECADFAQAFSNAGTAISQAFTGGDENAIDDVAKYFDEVSDKLPKEIRDDFGVFADAFEAFAQGLADAGIDFSDPSTVDQAKLSQLESLSAAFSSPEVTKASENIQAYVTENCQG